MAKRTKAPRPVAGDSVDEFLARLDHPRKGDIEALRAIVLGADTRIREAVKWNAPSFLIEEHFATFKLMPKETVQVVLHTGAKAKPRPTRIPIEDPQGILRWAANDRCVVTFRDARDIEAKKAALVDILRQWIDLTTR